MTPTDLATALARLWPDVSWTERDWRFAEASGYSASAIAKMRLGHRTPSRRAAKALERLMEKEQVR